MIGWMLANNVDDRHVGSTRIVQIGETVGETGAKMKESTCRFPRHSRITVCCCRHDALEETEHTADLRPSVQCCDDMQFRSARVRKAGFNPSGRENANQTFCSVHRTTSLGNLRRKYEAEHGRQPPNEIADEIYRSAKLLALSLTACLFQSLREHSGEGLVVCRDDSQMIARHSFDFELQCQLRPDCDRIMGKDGVSRCSQKFYFATIKLWLITGQSQIRAVPHALHRRAERNTNRWLIRRTPAEISKKTHPPSCLTCPETETLS